MNIQKFQPETQQKVNKLYSLRNVATLVPNSQNMRFLIKNTTLPPAEEVEVSGFYTVWPFFVR